MLTLGLQYWKGDREQAMYLARLVADLEQFPRTDVNFLFSSRFDCDHDISTVEYVRKKFPVHTWKCQRHGTGWPAGPNQMMADTYQWFVENTRNKKINSDAMLLMEADCVPLHQNWINMLIEEYKRANKMVMGCWLVAANGGGIHVNGNLIIHKDFWKTNRSIFTPSNFGGWDAIMANMILPNAHPSKLMFSDYRLGMEGVNPWRGCDCLWEPKIHTHPANPLYNIPLQPCYLHGPKDVRGLDCVRERLLP